jgi:hypothetical protein
MNTKTEVVRLRADLLRKVRAKARKKQWTMRMALDAIVEAGLQADDRTTQSKGLINV